MDNFDMTFSSQWMGLAGDVLRTIQRGLLSLLHGEEVNEPSNIAMQLAKTVKILPISS
jgi:hypothetical protein